MTFQIQGTNLASTSAISRNAWHHVVGVYDGSQMKLYIDGSSGGTPVAKTGSSVPAATTCKWVPRPVVDRGFKVPWMK